MAIDIPEGYSFVLFMNVLISFACLLVGFVAGSKRSSVFNKKYMEENFAEEIKDHPTLATGQGYPDVGNGYFSNKLSFDKWYAFNNAQRAHQNFLEGLTLIVMISLASGLVYTRLTVLCQIAYLVGRVMYAVQYIKSGPKGRLVGVLIVDVALLTLVVTSIMATLSLGGGIGGFINLVVGHKQQK